MTTGRINQVSIVRAGGRGPGSALSRRLGGDARAGAACADAPNVGKRDFSVSAPNKRSCGGVDCATAAAGGVVSGHFFKCALGRARAAGRHFRWSHFGNLLGRSRAGGHARGQTEGLSEQLRFARGAWPTAAVASFGPESQPPVPRPRGRVLGRRGLLEVRLCFFHYYSESNNANPPSRPSLSQQVSWALKRVRDC